MKRNFVFIAILLVVNGLFAASLKPLPQNNQYNTNKRLTSAEFSAGVVPFVQQDVRKTFRQSLNNEASVISADAARHAMPTRESAQDTLYLQADGFLVGPEYEDATGEWYVALEAQGYTFKLCWYAPKDNYCGSFGFYDFSWNYTSGWYLGEDVFYEIFPADITMTISEEQFSTYLKQMQLDATIEDSEGKVYQVHAVHQLFTPKQTIQTNLNDAQVSLGYEHYVLDGKSEQVDMHLVVNSTTIEGLYPLSFIVCFETNLAK